jgi:chorismate synthase
MRILTAGESHGKAETAILEGFPKGVKIEENIVNSELKRRQSGYGRGKRMQIEADTCEILSGVRNKITLGSPIAVLVNNHDARIFAGSNDNQPELVVPRPAHADLAASLKYGDRDIRNFLERASARETAARVCAGSLCKQFLANFNIKIVSFTVSVGRVESKIKPENIEEIIKKTNLSQLNCIDRAKEKLMLREIDKADKNLDTLGGVVEVWLAGACPGIGSFMHWDSRLDAKIAGALMSIPAIKGVEIGLGFAYAKCFGSVSHDQIFYSPVRGFYHKTNNSGGIEGGITNGESIKARIAMKPIATLRKPLSSVNLITKKSAKAIIERSDICAIAACGVIAESMMAIAVTESFLEKFGVDSLREIKANYHNYLMRLRFSQARRA